ncbi:MAG: hypothetical protein LC115_01670 [Bacteroidia bacterium]|nr:hypothetical protein [Bacteroidia bacterium]
MKIPVSCINMFSITRLCCVWLLMNAFFLTSCEITKNQDNNTTLNLIPEDDLNDLKHIFANIPSPVEVNEVLAQTGSPFTPSLLNPTTNAKKYVTSSVVALNLGVYLGDLSYCNAHHKNQEVLEYFQATNRLCEELSIEQVIDIKTIKQLDEKKQDNTALLELVTKIYEQTHTILEKNNRTGFALLIVTGAWLEGTHFNLRLLQQKTSPQLIKLLYGQYHSFLHIYNLFEKYPETLPKTVATKETLTEIKNRLKQLFGEANITSIDSLATIKTPEKFNVENLGEVAAKIQALRNQIISAS